MQVNRFLLVLSILANATLSAQVLTIKDAENAIKTKMDETINSPNYEGAPMLSPDGNVLFIYRTGHPKNIGIKKNPRDEDIWFSRKVSANKWAPMKNIGKPLNDSTNSAVCGISSDGNILFLYDFYSSVYFNGIAVSYRRSNGWSKPVHVDIEKFYMMNTLVWFHVSNDGKVLLMSLQRAETEGLSDIYVSFRLPSGKYSAPKNLGPVVNSRKNEASPFLAADNKTMYYASDGKPGYGNHDIFVTRRLDDTWLNWSVPENLGPKINTPNWDTEFSISADGKDAFMVSGGQSYGDNSDIYKVTLPKFSRPANMRMLYGYLTDQATGKPLQGDIRFYSGKETEVGSALPDPATGYFNIYLSDTGRYTIRAEKSGYLSVVETVDQTLLSKDSIRKDLKLVPLKKGGKVDLQNIYFEQSKYTLRQESFPQLKEIQKMMEENSRMKIKITGHTDNVGNPKDNLQLSLDRASEVKKYLIQSGIDGSRILVDGKGGKVPLYPNENDENRKLNRRVEFLILDI